MWGWIIAAVFGSALVIVAVIIGAALWDATFRG